MRRRVKVVPAAASVFGTLKGAPRAFRAPDADLHTQWFAWVAWESAFRRFETSHPELQEASDEVWSQSVIEIPDQPWDLAQQDV